MKNDKHIHIDDQEIMMCLSVSDIEITWNDHLNLVETSISYSILNRMYKNWRVIDQCRSRLPVSRLTLITLS
jgi:hypothetical protein